MQKQIYQLYLGCIIKKMEEKFSWMFSRVRSVAQRICESIRMNHISFRVSLNSIKGLLFGYLHQVIKNFKRIRAFIVVKILKTPKLLILHNINAIFGGMGDGSVI